MTPPGPQQACTLIAALILAVGCSSDLATPEDAALDLAVDLSGAVDRAAPDAARDVDPPDVALPDQASPDTANPDQAAPDAAPPTSLYTEARGVIHMHSIYSHDACDGKGFVSGLPNLTCLKQLRAAVCANKFDFMALTDHPSNMSKYTLQQDMLYDASAGDQLYWYQGKAIANMMACPGGGQVAVSVGFESKHMMPLGLHAKPAAQATYGGISDSTSPAAVKAQVAALKKLGAVVAMVHSEETDISAKTIVAGGFAAMEWYNIHGNITVLIGGDLLKLDLKNIPKAAALVGKLLKLSAFLSGGSGGPHPDLVYLLFLDMLPKQGFDKWRIALKTTKITGILGSDIHQNVSVDASVCSGTLRAVCNGVLVLVETTLGFKIPQVLKSLLLTGGQIQLADGDRVDSYGRLMRWLENRVLVKKVDHLQIMEALGAGRTYGLFSLFGDPAGFAFTGDDGGGGPDLQLGEEAKGPLTLSVKVPRPEKQYGVPFTAVQAAKAEVTARLYRTDSGGTTLVTSATTQGATLTQKVSQAGAYHVELWIKPKHLTQALGSSSALASASYLWVITNPIYLKKQ